MTCGAAILSATPTAWRALVANLSLCTSHQFSKPPPDIIRWGQWRRKCRREWVTGTGMLVFFPIKSVFASTEVCWQLRGGTRVGRPCS